MCLSFSVCRSSRSDIACTNHTGFARRPDITRELEKIHLAISDHGARLKDLTGEGGDDDDDELMSSNEGDHDAQTAVKDEDA